SEEFWNLKFGASPAARQSAPARRRLELGAWCLEPFLQVFAPLHLCAFALRIRPCLNAKSNIPTKKRAPAPILQPSKSTVGSTSAARDPSIPKPPNPFAAPLKMKLFTL